MPSTDERGDADPGEVIDILLVEPNRGDVRLFEESFTKGKIVNAIHPVSDGEAALEFVHQRGEYADAPVPDLVLLELLPGNAGMAVLAELNDEPALREIPVVVLTSSDLGADIVDSHGLEVDGYVRKPMAVEEFVEFVTSIEEFWVAIVKKESDR